MSQIREYNFSDILNEAEKISLKKNFGYVGVSHLFLAAISDSMPESYTKNWLKNNKQKSVLIFLIQDIEKNIPKCDSNKNIRTAKLENLIKRYSMETREQIIINNILNEDFNEVVLYFNINNISTDDYINEVRDKRLVFVDKEQAGSMENIALSKYARNLTLAAMNNQLEKAICRDEEIKQICRILLQQKKNNPILVGEPGVGKTAVIEGLAQYLLKEDVHPRLKGLKIFELDTIKLMSGTKYSGELEQRVEKILTQMKSDPTIVMFIDEFHKIVGMGRTEGSSNDLVNMFKPDMSRGMIKVIGATTFAEYNQYISNDQALERRIEMVRIKELDEQSTLEVLKRSSNISFKNYHGINIPESFLKESISLAEEYMPLKKMPDSVISILDRTLAEANLKNRKTITIDNILESIADMAGIDQGLMRADPKMKYELIKKSLYDNIFGQNEAIEAICKNLSTMLLKIFDRERPLGVFLFTGPSGTGKTFLAKQLAKAVFGSEENFLQIDMGAMKNENDITSLIGSPPGYVGYEKKGLLTNFIKSHPNSIILFDEVEKADKNIFDILLGLFNDGFIKDNHGDIHDAKNIIFILTSNIQLSGSGVSGIFNSKNNLDDDLKEKDDKLREELSKKHKFRVELINRVDSVIVFNQLSSEAIKKIIDVEIDKLKERIRKHNVELTINEDLYEYIIKNVETNDLGARPIKRMIKELITYPISSMIMDGALKIKVYIDTIDQEETVKIEEVK
ncbi:MAG TPA: ATP-dependent Clp protease ATP-binding subunit [Spirochaetota bacterium]|nr:ATP-dependent Clp protease ATP-binding subunit [Spirochaetota bacterium]HOS33937.1 ATP-dependent Clp protease ATP-binding subunit [Spirochaetota bacterium]HOS56870.1 ATP-dependent Clp protease ATP-binding subunit [Spirochaetota bacterium]HQF78890.1 ATP-dependent Clp protease ATP-binding subunit [Spirochaetota bacterium]HRU43983.1 ATP-dependent Clp protease ATP-binding subunit [Spirochaetota bacterium]